ncbi:MAG TPA: VanZ family protein [Sphingomicrobium sp.]
MRIVTDNAGQPLARTAFWVTILAVLVIALWPQPPSLTGGIYDKVQHALAFITLTLLAVWAFPRLSPAWIIAVLSAYGAMIEILQGTPLIHRDRSILDWVADTVACAIVLGGLRWRALRRRWH